MVAVARTSEFREILKEKQRATPEPKRRKTSKRSGADGQREAQDRLGKEYLAEGYVILKHIQTLAKMLASVRKVYLNVDARSTPLLRGSPRTLDLSAPDASWASVRYLTNEERDQIDLQARVVLTRCAERVREMEALEKRRAELVQSRRNPFARLLPARLLQDDAAAASDFVAAHHSSITWYLSRRLAEASALAKEMQEERMRRQVERTRTLGAGASLYTDSADVSLPSPAPSSSSASGSVGGGWLGVPGNFASSFMGSQNASGSGTGTLKASTLPPDEELDSTDDEELELSASQIQQFEAENAHILRSVQDTLHSVQQAEARLAEIGALQVELVKQLTRQTEQTEQLYDDAIATAATVEKGNVQLREARRRARDSRKWILLFLIGASLSLLFLHYY